MKFKRLPGNDLPLPERATQGSAGFDLRACVTDSLVLASGERALIPTGFAVEIPEGCEGQIRPRSGLALRQGLTLLNSPGTIDSDYRGEVSVIAINLGASPVTISRGDRIAQMVIHQVASIEAAEVPDVGARARGQGGFGSSGSR